MNWINGVEGVPEKIEGVNSIYIQKDTFANRLNPLTRGRKPLTVKTARNLSPYGDTYIVIILSFVG